MKFYKLEDGSGRYLGIEDEVPIHIIEVMPELIENGLIDTSYENTYSETEYQHAVHPEPPTWKNTLYNHLGIGGQVGGSGDMMNLANSLGYIYFCWNERIYKITNRNGDVQYEDIGLFGEDLD